jgi:hypothetical protein
MENLRKRTYTRGEFYKGERYPRKGFAYEINLVGL